MRSNAAGQEWMSKPERGFRYVLEQKFGREDVMVQQLIKRKWSIDFYVMSINVYVQFDGVYWHGLDRSIEVIKASTQPRDMSIYKKWVKDRELDAYAIKNGMTLIRVTDIEFKADPQACLFRIVGKSDGTSLPNVT
jgi:hypothetical protein